MGRHSSYTETKGLEICQRIADGESLRAICADDGMPNKSTVFRWLVDNDTFRDQYSRAREDQAEDQFDRITEIVNKLENGDVGPNEARVMIDAIKWQAGKLKPQKYSDKYVHEVSGPNGGPIEYTDTERAAKIASLIEQARLRADSGKGET